jgi:hypothetical protein
MKRRVAFILSVFVVAHAGGRIRADLVSEWRFNETSGTTAADNVGGITGNLIGGATFDPGAGPGGGVYSGALMLDATVGSGQYVDMGKVYPFTSGDFTISVWINTTHASSTLTNQGQIVLSEHHTTFVNGYFMALNNVGDGLATTGSHFYASGTGVGSTQNVNDGVWHMLTEVYSASGSMSYYIDGQLKATAGHGGIGSNNADFLVGGVLDGSSGLNVGTYTGLISDVRVYNSALSASDVQSVYDTVLASAVAPEPSTFIAFATGGVAIGAFGWRRGRLSRRLSHVD